MLLWWRVMHSEIVKIALIAVVAVLVVKHFGAKVPGLDKVAGLL